MELSDYEKRFFSEWHEGRILIADIPTSRGQRVAFYQIVERTPRTVKVRQLKTECTASATGVESIPRPNDFRDTEPPFSYAPRRKLQPTGHISVNDVTLARLWDGRPSIYPAH